MTIDASPLWIASRAATGTVHGARTDGRRRRRRWFAAARASALQKGDESVYFTYRSHRTDAPGAKTAHPPAMGAGRRQVRQRLHGEVACHGGGRSIDGERTGRAASVPGERGAPPSTRQVDGALVGS